MILKGVAGTSIMSGTPWGKQRPEGRSLLKFSCRSLYSASAHGWKGTWTPSAVMLFRYLPSGFLQIPVRSGLPSGVFGTGAVRLGFPSGVRGVFGSGTFTHWRKRIAIAVAVKFIGIVATVAPFWLVCKDCGAALNR